jgi:hypothetical protein
VKLASSKATLPPHRAEFPDTLQLSCSTVDNTANKPPPPKLLLPASTTLGGAPLLTLFPYRDTWRK